jgi:hypothetical protein
MSGRAIRNLLFATLVIMGVAQTLLMVNEFHRLVWGSP